MVGVYDVVTSAGGTICTETHDANPAEIVVYDLVGIDWVAQP